MEEASGARTEPRNEGDACRSTASTVAKPQLRNDGQEVITALLQTMKSLNQQPKHKTRRPNFFFYELLPWSNGAKQYITETLVPFKIFSL